MSESSKTPPSNENGVERLMAVVHDLRSPGGCPWDREQTHESLVPNLLEEAYEAVDAIRSGDKTHMEEELGDLLLQVVMHGEMGSETDDFDLNSLAHVTSEKLIRRHPHVYGSSGVDDTEGVLQQWDQIKRQEKGDGDAEPYLKRVGEGLPAMMRAQKLQKKAAKVGFDWSNTEGVLEKIREELAEVEEAATEEDPEHLAEEIGDLLFAAINLARKSGLDAEVALAETNQKFLKRFAYMERSLIGEGKSLEEASLDEMEAKWQASKLE